MESFFGLVFHPKSHVVAPGEALEDDPVRLLDNTLGPSEQFLTCEAKPAQPHEQRMQLTSPPGSVRKRASRL